MVQAPSELALSLDDILATTLMHGIVLTSQLAPVVPSPACQARFHLPFLSTADSKPFLKGLGDPDFDIAFGGRFKGTSHGFLIASINHNNYADATFRNWTGFIGFLI
jgi:hypothetical protein